MFGPVKGSFGGAHGGRELSRRCRFPRACDMQDGRFIDPSQAQV